MILYFCKLNKFCRSGETGRRTGLKIQRWQHRAGSTPAFGTSLSSNLLWLLFFYLNFHFNFLGGTLRVVLSDPDRKLVAPGFGISLRKVLHSKSEGSLKLATGNFS